MTPSAKQRLTGDVVILLAGAAIALVVLFAGAL